MRPRVREFVREMATALPLKGPVYEFGSRRLGRQDELANLRPLFSGLEYVGCDMRKGRGVDRILNLHDIDLLDEIAGTVLCLETLEHVEFCHRAVAEMHRILKPGGICLLSSVMNCAIHKYPNDYWRFTPAGFESLLGCFQSQRVTYAGEQRFPHTVFGIGAKGIFDWAQLDGLP